MLKCASGRSVLHIVLDTNVLLVAIPPHSPFRWIYDAFLAERITLCVTTEILAEYAEIFDLRANAAAGADVLSALLTLPNVAFITPHYRFNLLADPDDNKFVDCAVAANADLLATHDRDFDVLRQVAFPVVPFGDVTALAALLAL